MALQTTIDTIIDTIGTLYGITGVRLWNKIPGKERLYITTTKWNGGKNWNGGVGYATLYIDVASKRLVAQDVAGAATRNELGDTLAALRTLAATL